MVSTRGALHVSSLTAGCVSYRHKRCWWSEIRRMNISLTMTSMQYVSIVKRTCWIWHEHLRRWIRMCAGVKWSSHTAPSSLGCHHSALQRGHIQPVTLTVTPAGRSCCARVQTANTCTHIYIYIIHIAFSIKCWSMVSKLFLRSGLPCTAYWLSWSWYLLLASIHPCLSHSLIFYLFISLRSLPWFAC